MNENTDPGPTTAKPEPLTIKEIARLAGVSIGTVDRVIHHRGRVSAENTAKIEALIADQGYRPNLFASRLKAGATVKTIGVAIPRADQDFGYWGLIARGLEASAKDLEPMQVQVEYAVFDRRDPADLARAFASLVEAGCGALALAPIHTRTLRPLVEALDPALPLLFFDTDMECSRPHSFLGQDPVQGGRLAAQVLDRGLAPGVGVVLVKFEEDDEHLRRRGEGFAAYCAARNRPVLILTQDLGAPADLRRRALEGLLDAHPEAGGLFVPNASVGEYTRLSRPLQTVGYDLIPRNVEALRQGLLDAVLSQRPETMGAEAVRLLARTLLFREPCPAATTLPIDLVLSENLEGFLAPG